MARPFLGIMPETLVKQHHRHRACARTYMKRDPAAESHIVILHVLYLVVCYSFEVYPFTYTMDPSSALCIQLMRIL